MAESKYKIVFGSSERQRFILQPISPLSKSPPGDSVLMQVTVHTGDFSGNTKVPISVEMLKHTLQALSEFSENPSGEFTLYSESREFWASMTADSGEKIVAHCILNDCKNRYTRLRFEVIFSIKEIPHIADTIKKLLQSLAQNN